MVVHVLPFLCVVGLSVAQEDRKQAKDQPRLVIPVGHSGVITSLNVSENEALLTSYGYQEGLSKLWDVQTGKQLELNQGADDLSHYRSYELTPGGEYLGVSSLNGIDIVRVGSNEVVLHIEDSVFSAYSHDKSKLVVEVKGSNRYNIYSTKNFELLKEVGSLPDFMYLSKYSFLELDAKNDLLFTEHTKYEEDTTLETVAIIDLKSEEVRYLPVNGRGAEGERMISFGTNNDYLITEQYYSGDDFYQVIRIYDKTNGEKVREIKSEDFVKSIGTTENGNYLWYTAFYSMGWDDPIGWVYIYDLQKQEYADSMRLEDYQFTHEEYTSKYFSLNDWLSFDPKYRYHDESKTNYVFCPDIPDLDDQLGLKIFEDIDYGTSVEIRNIATDTLVSVIDAGRDFRYFSATFLNKGANVIVAFENDISLHDVRSGRKIRTFESNSEDLTVFAADSSEKNLVVGTKLGNVHILQKDLNKFSTIHVGNGASRVIDLMVSDNVLICGGNNFLNTWDLKTNEPLLDFSNIENNYIGSVSALELVTVGNRKYLKTEEYFLLDREVTEENIYDLATGEKLVNSHDIISFTPQAVVFKGYDSSVYYWNYSDSARLISSFFPKEKFDFYHATDIVISPNSRYMVTVTGNKMQFWDTQNGKRKHDLKFKELEDYYDYLFDPKSESLFFTDIGNAYHIDLQSGKLKNKWSKVLNIKIIEDRLIMEKTDNHGISLIYDTRSGGLLYEIKNSGRVVDYLKDQNLFVILESLSNRVLFYDPVKQEVVSINPNQLNLFKEKIKYFDETETFRNYRTGNLYGIQGNELLSFNVYDGSLSYRLIPLGTDEMITVLPEGYYQATKDATKKLHYVTNDLKVITFDQLDLRYNRPDKVLKVLGNTDTLLINSYKRAYDKRIQKIGVDTTLFNESYSVPEADITNREKISYELSAKLLKLHIRGWDSTYHLDRFNLWVNETPIFGERGISLKNRRTHVLDTSLIIELSPGQNRIETSIVNINQIESYRKPLYVNYTDPDNPAGIDKFKTHFIGIGIDKFSEPGHELSYSVKDVRDLSKALKEKLGDQLTIDTLFNENVSVSNVQALKRKLLKTNINDKVIISYSGHGLLNEEYDYFLSAYTVDFHHPENGGIPYEVLEDLLDSIPARKKLLLIDACHSGEVDKEDMREMTAVAGAKGIVKPRGAEAENNSDDINLGLQNSFQLMQELFVNVQKGSGATIISAAAGNQFALEGGQLENGFFTYAILKYMKDHEEVSINALKRYVYAEVEILSGGMQKPTSRIENLEMDWKFW